MKALVRLIKWLIITAVALVVLTGCKTAPTSAWNRVPPPAVIEVCKTEAEIFGQLLARQIPPLQIQNTLQYRVVERVNVNGKIEQCSGRDCIVSISSTDASVIKKQLELSSSAVYTSMFLEGEISGCGASRCSVDLTESMDSYAQRSYAAIGQNTGDAYAQAGENIANAIRRSTFKAEVKDLANKRMRQCLKIAGYYEFEIKSYADYLKAEESSISVYKVRGLALEDSLNLMYEARIIRECNEAVSDALLSLAEEAGQLDKLAREDSWEGITEWSPQDPQLKPKYAAYLNYADDKVALRVADNPPRRDARRECNFDLDLLRTQ